MTIAGKIDEGLGYKDEIESITERLKPLLANRKSIKKDIKRVSNELLEEVLNHPKNKLVGDKWVVELKQLSPDVELLVPLAEVPEEFIKQPFKPNKKVIIEDADSEGNLYDEDGTLLATLSPNYKLNLE